MSPTRRALLPWLAAPWVAPALAEGQHWRLRMPSPPFHEPVDQPFNRELLTLALQQVGDRLTLLRSAPQTWARQVRELQQGLVDLAPLPAVDGAYQGFALRRVDFPLRPGLLGLRLLLVRQDRVAELSRIDSLDRLRRETRLGYGADWADRELMQKLGFRLVLARSTEGLYGSLLAGECDVLSRGLKEVDGELRQLGRESREIAVLPELALHYPLDDCFYLAPRHERLQTQLLAGLQRCRADGSWLRLLARHYGGLLRRHAFERRRIWRIEGYPAPHGLEPELLDAALWLPRLLAAA